MTFVAVFIIILSSIMHATWNYYAKMSNGGMTFVWIYQGLSTVLFTPFVILLFIIQEIKFSWAESGFIIASGLLHLAYSLMLQKGYKKSDLSLVYPMARGVAPVVVSIGAVILFNEQLSGLGILGISLIILSIFIISGGLKVFQSGKITTSIFYGLLIGVSIAGYTLLDKGALAMIMISPLLLHYGSIVVQFLMLTPFIKRNWEQVSFDWKHYRKEAIGVGVLQPLAYILILITMTFTPVSYVAPVREISIIIGALLGTFLLKEEFGYRRIVGSIVMFIGIVIIAVS